MPHELLHNLQNACLVMFPSKLHYNTERVFFLNLSQILNFLFCSFLPVACSWPRGEELSPECQGPCCWCCIHSLSWQRTRPLYINKICVSKEQTVKGLYCIISLNNCLILTTIYQILNLSFMIDVQCVSTFQSQFSETTKLELIKKCTFSSSFCLTRCAANRVTIEKL